MWLILGPTGVGKSTLLRQLKKEFPKALIASVDGFIKKYGFNQGWKEVYEVTKRYSELILESVGLYWKNEDLGNKKETQVIIIWAEKTTINKRLINRQNEKNIDLYERLDEIRCSEKAQELLPNLYSKAIFIENDNSDKAYEQLRFTIFGK